MLIANALQRDAGAAALTCQLNDVRLQLSLT